MIHLSTRATALVSTRDARDAGAVDPIEWLRAGQRPHLLHVRQVPLAALSDWAFEPATGNLRHRTGRFFSIEGVHVTTNYGAIARWTQPIIDQPEVGILGLLVARDRGTLQVLAQRKIEPGNVNVAQISPTLQATESNYTRVHGGSRPRYLEYFVALRRGTVLADQLQVEQAARYGGKRNRNIIVEVDRDEVPLAPDFRWIGLGELTACAHVPSALNLDMRSVLSCLPASLFRVVGGQRPDAPFAVRVAHSLTCDCACERLAEIRAWLLGLRQSFWMEARKVPLRAVSGWHHADGVIAHESGRFFEVLGVSVEAPTREVTRWDQPLVRGTGRGITGLLCQQQDGLLRFLARGVLEPGQPMVRVGPTVQCIPANHRAPPPYLAEIARAPESQVRLRTVQSEEGGRFYRDERDLVVVELAPDAPVEARPEYMWLTLRELKELIATDGVVNIEARSLIACLPFIA
jgi:oxidase EvaA